MGSNTPDIKNLWRRIGSSRLVPLLLILWGVALAAYVYGYYSRAHDSFPGNLIPSTVITAQKVMAQISGRPFAPYYASNARQTVVAHRPAAMAPGLTLISGIGPNGSLFARLVDADGVVRHAWPLDPNRLWPNSPYAPAQGVMGMVLSANGDLTFNLEYLGLIQIDSCGRPKWRLAHQTHHSLVVDDDGNFWAPEYADRNSTYPGMPNIRPPFTDQFVLEASPQGKLLRRISIFDLLKKNGYEGLLYLSSLDEPTPRVSQDILHLNSVAIYPKAWKPGLFQAGDVLVSLRNTNAVFVFDPKTEKIKAMVTGRFVRQHDARFLDGWSISVLDNNSLGLDAAHQSSRIVRYDFGNGRTDILFEGTPAHPFYTVMMGKQHGLPNGDLLLTEAMNGRVLEVDPKGEILWEYNNLVAPGVVGQLEDAERVPPGFMSSDMVKQLDASCAASSAR